MKALNIFLVLLCLGTSLANAQFYRKEDIVNFQRYNPDGKKYEFVKSYLTGLEYLKKNHQRAKRVLKLRLEDLDQAETIKNLLKDLVDDSVNLRIARNFVKRFEREPNGFILKVTHLFVEVCNQQIALNKEEQAHIQTFYEESLALGMKGVDRESFFHHLESLAYRRRASLQKLLEASLLVKKLLISHQTDDYGEFVTLGITEKQREKLLFKLQAFYEEGFQGTLREGQTFLEGSVAVIREILEDPTWDTLDG